MTKMTSAYANKFLKKLAEDKEYWRKKETEGCTYIAALDEEPVIPDYDSVSNEIIEIDERIVKIKHAINVNNVNNKIDVGGREMNIDACFIS